MHLPARRRALHAGPARRPRRRQCLRDRGRHCYNAALLKHPTGKSGQVTTRDVAPDVTAYARRTQDANGYEDVRVVTRDGALGAQECSPYDWMIATLACGTSPASGGTSSPSADAS
ncbi:hypothetical protein [Streptomyces sp. NPDC001286]